MTTFARNRNRAEEGSKVDLPELAKKVRDVRLLLFEYSMSMSLICSLADVLS